VGGSAPASRMAADQCGMRVVDTISQLTIPALTCHTCAAPLRFPCAVTAEEYGAEASPDLPLNRSHLGGPSSRMPLPHQAATPDLP
jgi:hypothetical protein